MKLRGSYTFAATPEALWPLLQDPAVLQAILPGCRQLTATGDNQFQGELLIRVGPMTGIYQGTLILSDLQKAQGYTFTFTASSEAGTIGGNGRIQLENQNGVTILHYEGKANVGGQLTRHATPLLETSARSLIRQSLERLGQYLQTQKMSSVAHIFPDDAQAPLKQTTGIRQTNSPILTIGVITTLTILILAVMFRFLGRKSTP
jgi:carbon monoxide dehydrogenase subunit G